MISVSQSLSINVSELTDSDIGRRVIYVRPRRWGGTVEEGRVTSYNRKYIFADFGTGHGKACDPSDLEWKIRR